jgi:hypothetical protein
MSWRMFGIKFQKKLIETELVKIKKVNSKNERSESLCIFTFLLKNLRFISVARRSLCTKGKPRLKYASLTNDGKAALYEQGNAWHNTKRDCPGLDKVKYSYTKWIKGTLEYTFQYKAEKLANNIKNCYNV